MFGHGSELSLATEDALGSLGSWLVQRWLLKAMHGHSVLLDEMWDHLPGLLHTTYLESRKHILLDWQLPLIISLCAHVVPASLCLSSSPQVQQLASGAGFVTWETLHLHLGHCARTSLCCLDPVGQSWTCCQL